MIHDGIYFQKLCWNVPGNAFNSMLEDIFQVSEIWIFSSYPPKKMLSSLNFGYTYTEKYPGIFCLVNWNAAGWCCFIQLGEPLESSPSRVTWPACLQDFWWKIQNNIWNHHLNISFYIHKQSDISNANDHSMKNWNKSSRSCTIIITSISLLMNNSAFLQ